jgi:hypothetical protein
MLVAAILIGAGVLAFVAYTTYDVVGFGKEVVYGDSTAAALAAQVVTIGYSAESEPVVTIWKGATGATFNGTVSAAKVAFDGGKQVTITYAGGGYPPDTTYLKFNYTGQGSAARAITMPAILLISVFAIVVVAGVMVRGTSNLGGKGKGGKSFP